MNEVDQYISKFPEEVQEKLVSLRNLIETEVPEATQRICMGIPTFDLNGKWLVHFAAFTNHIGFYPQPDTIVVFKEKLREYKTSKGTIQFPLSKPLPLNLIKEMIFYRVKTDKQL